MKRIRVKPVKVEPAVLVFPYCRECGQIIESLRGACPVKSGTSNYVCRQCEPLSQEGPAKERSHILGLPDVISIRGGRILARHLG